MKANANKRKIFDAVDLLTEESSAQITEANADNGVEEIAIDKIKAFIAIPSTFMRESGCRTWWSQ